MNVRELISLHEGRVAHAYQDSLGYWTIGVGHLVDQRKGGKLPESIIDALLDLDIHEHANELFAVLPWVRDMDPIRQAAMIDLYFNMRRNLLGFKETLRHLQSGQWEQAATALLDSKWATQVGTRARRVSEMIRTGEWPSDV